MEFLSHDDFKQWFDLTCNKQKLSLINVSYRKTILKLIATIVRKIRHSYSTSTNKIAQGQAGCVFYALIFEKRKTSLWSTKSGYSSDRKLSSSI